MKQFVLIAATSNTSNTIGLNLHRDDDRSIDLGMKASPDTPSYLLFTTIQNMKDKMCLIFANCVSFSNIEESCGHDNNNKLLISHLLVALYRGENIHTGFHLTTIRMRIIVIEHANA